jgi:uncharacterized protein YqeY
MKNKQIDVRHELSDQEVQDVVKTQVKQLKDAIESFTSGGREDLATNARMEIGLLEQFLPTQMSDEELLRVVKEVVEKSGVTSKADMGKVMGQAMAAVAGRADGSRVKALVATMLPVLLLVVSGLTVAQHALAAVPIIDTLASGPSYASFLLRITRVLMLWLGVVAITLILKGGFDYMIASYRDDEHIAALTKMTQGIFATLIIAGLFSFCTLAIGQIGS